MLDIIFLLDESYSMNKFSSIYVKTINKFIDRQKIDNPNAYFTMFTFNNNFKQLCVDFKISDLNVFKDEYYNPTGLTRLYDTINHMLEIKKNSKRRTIFFILTDGEDNKSFSSIYNTAENIEEYKRKGWEFIYIASNQNAKKVGERLNIDTCITYNETNKSIEEIVNSCNTIIGKIIHKWTGVHNIYSDKILKDDISDLSDVMNNISI